MMKTKNAKMPKTYRLARQAAGRARRDPSAKPRVTVNSPSEQPVASERSRITTTLLFMAPALLALFYQPSAAVGLLGVMAGPIALLWVPDHHIKMLCEIAVSFLNKLSGDR